MQEYNNILQHLPLSLSSYLCAVPQSIQARVVELRLRIGKPPMLVTTSESIEPIKYIPTIVDNKLLQETLLCITNRALHSKQMELAKGYVTMPGGNRVGVAGTAVVENGNVVGIKDITSLNIRVARNDFLPPIDMLAPVLNKAMFSLLIVGAPRSGKTTILKSVAAAIAQQKKQFTVVDTRCEIAPDPNKYFSFCDVLSGYPRSQGIVNALKSLAPQVILCDEIGDEEDAKAIEMTAHCGANIVVTAHADSLKTLCNRPVLLKLLELTAFSHVAILDSANNPGVVKEVMRWNG